MGKNYTAEVSFKNNPDFKRKQDAKRSMNNYVNQLKLHFDLSDKDLLEVINMVYMNNKNNIPGKKWWHIWK